MAQESDQIKEHIDRKRAEVTRDLNELEYQVKDQVRQVSDWRTHYRSYPGAFLGAAFGGGVLLAWLARGKQHSHVRQCCC